MITLREWILKQKPIDDLIIQASSTDGNDRWQPFPIGMQFSYAYNYKKGDSIQIGHHNNTVLCAITSSTDQRRRPRGLNRQLFINNSLLRPFMPHHALFLFPPIASTWIEKNKNYLY